MINPLLLQMLMRSQQQPQEPESPQQPYGPGGSALARLMSFQSQSPGFLTQLGLGGGLQLPIQSERGSQHRGANTARQVLRGILGGLNAAAMGRAREYTGKEDMLQQEAKAELWQRPRGGATKEPRDPELAALEKALANAKVGTEEAQADYYRAGAEERRARPLEKTRHNKAEEARPRGTSSGKGGGKKPSHSREYTIRAAELKQLAKDMKAKNPRGAREIDNWLGQQLHDLAAGLGVSSVPRSAGRSIVPDQPVESEEDILNKLSKVKTK